MVRTSITRVGILFATFLFAISLMVCGLESAYADEPAAKIGDTEYATLQKAIDAAENGNTITLLRDVAEQLSVSAKQITIDCAGHTLSGEGVNRWILRVFVPYEAETPVALTVKNGTFTGFVNDEPMINLQNIGKAQASLTFSNCVFKDNLVTGNENHLIQINTWNQKASAWTLLDFYGCRLIDNKSEGGGILYVNSARGYYNRVSFTDTLVANNTSKSGAVQTASTTTFSMKGSVIKDNIATGLPNYDNYAGGLTLYAYKATMDNSAIYNNKLQDPGRALGTANDVYVYYNTASWRDLSGMLAAKDMVDPFDSTADFSDMVWKDGKRTGYDEKLPKNVEASSYYTVMPASALQVAQINDDPDKIYETLEAAFAAAGAGDTVKLIAKEQTVDVKEGITVSSGITFDAADHKVKFAKTGGIPLFTVQPGASLAMYNTQSSDPNNKILGGIELGSILVEDGGALTIEDAMDTNGIENNGTLTVNAVLQDVAVKLEPGKVVQLGAAYNDVTPSSTSFTITLDDITKAALNDGSSSVVRVVEGGSEAIEPAVKVAGITNGAVVKEYAEGGIQLRIVKAIYLSGSGNDSNTGTKAAPVKTFAQAKELLEENPDYDAIIICNTVPVADTQTWSLPAGKSILRDAAFTGELVHVRAGGALTLENITLDGRRIDARDPLVKVDEGGTLNIQDGAELKNNRNVRQDLYGWGGAVYSAGATNMTGGTIEGNASGFGGGVFQYGGTFNMMGGVIQNNDARLTAPSRGNGGGVFLIAGAKMTMDSGASRPIIRNNTTRGDGGGIALGGYEYVGKNWFITYVNGQAVSLGTSLVMKDGIIDGNSAAISGGGIFVQDSTSAYIYGGEITNNTALGNNARFAGGGIYVNGIHTLIDPETGIRYHVGPGLMEDEEGLTHGFLYLENVEICNNTAKWLGGALATCNVSQTIVGDLSTAIHDNSIENAGVSPSSTSGANVDVFLSNVGHGNTNVGSSHPLAYLSNYMIGGGDYAWTNSRGMPIDPAYLYENRVSTQVVTPVSSDSSEMQTATAGAKVLISGNYGGANGGGLGSNGIIVLGSIAPKVDVAVTKTWDDTGSEASRPTSLKFNLYRAAGQSGAKELYKTHIVEADENGAIAYTWDNLLKYVPDTNNQTEYVYTVEEDTDYVAQDANGNTVKIGNMYDTMVKQVASTTRAITRPNPNGLVDTLDQEIRNFEATNTVKPIQCTLDMSKTVLGTPDAAAEFTFTLVPQQVKTLDGANLIDEQGQPVYAPLPHSSDGDTTKVTSVITLHTQAGIANQKLTDDFGTFEFSEPAEYTYEVAEVVPNSLPDGWIYDRATFTVTYVVTRTEGQLALERTIVKTDADKQVAEAGEVAFVNSFNPLITTDVLKVEKTVEGEKPLHDTFVFELRPLNSDSPLPDHAQDGVALATVDNEGEASFGTIEFSKAGEYRYLVSEVAGSVAGYTYDATAYQVIYRVTSENGKLAASKTILEFDSLQAAQDAGAQATTADYPAVNKLEFKNIHELAAVTPAAISVQKTITGQTPTVIPAFTFVLEPQDEANDPMPEGLEGPAQLIEIAGNGTAHFSPITFEHEGTYSYTVREIATNAAGWTYDSTVHEVSFNVVANDQAQLVATATIDGVETSNVQVAFENSYKHVPNTADGIEVRKHVSGDRPEHAQQFAFVLEALRVQDADGKTREVSGAPMPAGAGDQTSTRIEIHGAELEAFAPITFNAPGIYSYALTETAGVAGGYTYDASTYEITYTVTDEGGDELTIMKTITRNGSAYDSDTDILEFTNEFKRAPVQGIVELAKSIMGDAPDKPQEFQFTIAAEEGAPLPSDTTAQVAGAGNTSFAPIVFTEPGIYAYVVEEALRVAPGWVFDNEVYEVEFAVEEADGALSATPTITRQGSICEAVEFVNSFEESKEPEPEPSTEPEPSKPEPSAEPEPSAPVDVVLVKYLKDALIHAEEFSFGLYDENGALLDTVHTVLGVHTGEDEHTSSVTIAFKDLIYTAAGTYRYTIREHAEDAVEVVEGDTWNQAGFEPGFYKGGVRYDDRTYEVVIVVVDEDGELNARVSYPGSIDGVHLYNEYSEEYVEIDGFDSHPNDGLHITPEPEPEPLKPEPEPEPAMQTEEESSQQPEVKLQESQETTRPSAPATPAAVPSSKSNLSVSTAPNVVSTSGGSAPTPAVQTARTADTAALLLLAIILVASGVGMAATFLRGRQTRT